MQEQQPQAHKKKFEVQKSGDKRLTNDVILKYCIDDWQGLLAHGWNETNRKLLTVQSSARWERRAWEFSVHRLSQFHSPSYLSVSVRLHYRVASTLAWTLRCAVLFNNTSVLRANEVVHKAQLQNRLRWQAYHVWYNLSPNWWNEAVATWYYCNATPWEGSFHWLHKIHLVFLIVTRINRLAHRLTLNHIHLSLNTAKMSFDLQKIESHLSSRSYVEG